MKKHLINFLLIALFISNFQFALGQYVFEPYDSKEKLESDVKEIINDLDLFIKDKGINPPYIPSVKIQTALPYSAIVVWHSIGYCSIEI